jgi:hypothetical protein
MKRFGFAMLAVVGLFLAAHASAQLSCPFSQSCNVSGPSFTFINPHAGGTAIRAQNTATTSNGVGIDGESFAAGGAGVNAAATGTNGTGLVAASVSGNIIIGQSGLSGTNKFRVDNSGNVHAASYIVGGADVAEFVASKDRLEPGDVVEIDVRHAGLFRKASTPYGTAVAGVISSAPGVTMNSPNSAVKANTGPQLALVGRVPVKVTASNGAIHVGDLLVASSVQGRAMRAGKAPGAGTVIGKALGNLNAGEGTVEMLVWSR